MSWLEERQTPAQEIAEQQEAKIAQRLAQGLWRASARGAG